jgi:3D (Asp-Asp-Asp) domain-containing protein
MSKERRLTAEQRQVLEAHGLPRVKRRRRYRLSQQGKDILMSWIVIAALFFLIGFLMGAVVVERDVSAAAERTLPAVSRRSYPLSTISAVQPPQEPETASAVQEPIPTQEIVTAKPVNAGIAFHWDSAVRDYVSLGEFKLTSYCACEKCCGYWATIRPTDENGEPIVYTASGAVARQGVTVAADTDLLPYGTVLLIGGEEFIVQDCGGGVQGKHIDIYFEDHQAAIEFGVRHEEIYREGDM